MNGYQMTLFKKIFLSIMVACSFASHTNAMQFKPDKITVQIFTTTLVMAAKEDPSLGQFAKTAQSLLLTSRKFLAILEEPNDYCRNLCIQALRTSNINLNQALFFITKENQNTWLIPLLVFAGADINAKDDLGYTPLHWAAITGNLNVTQVLLNSFAYINIQDNEGGTPLHFAAYNGNLATAQQLILAGANINAPKNDGYTPLHLAAISGQISIVSTLITAGANTCAIACDGKTPLQVALESENPEIVNVLTEARKNTRPSQTQQHYRVELQGIKKYYAHINFPAKSRRYIYTTATVNRNNPIPNNGYAKNKCLIQ